MSGDLQAVGVSQTHGVTLAVNAINAQGGLLGKKLQIVTRDDASDPAQAAAQARAMVEQVKPPVVFGGSSQGPSEAIEPVVAAANIINFPGTAFSGDINAQKYPLAFRSYITEVSQREAMIAQLQKHHYTKVALYYVNNASGEVVADSVMSAVGAAGITIVNKASFATASPDLTPIAIQAKNAHPQAVLVCATALADFSTIAKALHSEGVNVPVLATAAALNPTFGAVTKDTATTWSATGFRSFFYSGSGGGDPRIVKFIHDDDQIGGKDDLLTATALFYDAVNIWAQGVKMANSFDPQKVAAAIEQIKNYQGLLGVANFSPTQHDGLNPNAMAMGIPTKINKNGLYQLAP
jgi:branched-chain amino acid transport system substrate-binding protein